MEIARHWRLKAQRYRLEGSACPICGQLSFPPRLVCLECTAQPTQIASAELLALPAAIGLADIQTHLSQYFAEKLIG